MEHPVEITWPNTKFFKISIPLPGTIIPAEDNIITSREVPIGISDKTRNVTIAPAIVTLNEFAEVPEILVEGITLNINNKNIKN